jgi:hypothetical protein
MRAAPAPSPEAQAAQLVALHAAAAIVAGLARMPGDLPGGDPEACEALRRRGLADRRTRRTLKGGQVRIYWLTPAGVLAARRLKERG